MLVFWKKSPNGKVIAVYNKALIKDKKAKGFLHFFVQMTLYAKRKMSRNLWTKTC